MQTQAAVKLDLAPTQIDAVTPLSTLQNRGEFIDRHIGPNTAQIEAMLQTLGLDSLESLVDQTVPAAVSYTHLTLPTSDLV